MSIVSPRRRPRGVISSSNGQPYEAHLAADFSFDLGATCQRPDWSVWKGVLAERWRSAALPSLPGQKLHPLLWGVAIEAGGGLLDGASLETIAQAGKIEQRKASPAALAKVWSQQGDVCQPVVPHAALALVAWARTIPALARVAADGEWWAMVDRLAAISQTALDEPGDVWLRQLLASELALTLGHWFSDVPSCSHLSRRGTAALERSLLDDVDDDGFVRESPPEQWLPLLACWTRSRMLVTACHQTLQPDAAARYQDVVEALLRLARNDGGSIWPAAARPKSSDQLDLWRATAPFVELRVQHAIATAFSTSLAVGVARGRSISAIKKAADLPPPSANSERAGLAVLRPSWTAPRLRVDYRGRQICIGLDRNGLEYFAGECNPAVVIDGRPLSPQSPWEQSCWISDDDVDYLELQIELAADVRVQRHILFAREDEFVFLADAVLGERAAAIEYQTTLSLGAKLTVESAAESRELSLLQGGRRRAVVVPLALAEWRSDRRWGELSIESQGVRLSQSARQASNLFAPWFIDLSGRRLTRPLTWRRLTVAEDRETVPDDMAVGYRVQAGRQQWLFYRSLAACGNRTLLGHNLVSEFLAARFSRKGVAETLIEIEAPATADE
jgi:hypothetical protein